MGLIDAHLVPAVDGVAYGLLLYVAAAGLTLAFGTGDVLNLAHGALYAVGAYTAAALSDGSWRGMLLALAAGTAAAGAGGGLLAVLTAPVRRRGHLAQALLTFGVALVGVDLLSTAAGPDDLPVTLPAALDGSADLGGHRYPVYRLAFILVAALMAATGQLLLRRTRAGALLRATVDDPAMVAGLGTDPRLVHTAVLAGAGALAGLAGVLGAPIIGPGPRTADTVLLLSLIVVVLGGLGSVLGALVAAVAVGEVQTLGVDLVPDLAPYLLFTAMAAALVLRRGSTAGARG
ncbi:branched-chain amino acid ABC transporter permease [Kitasatospora sp. RG8]|uniref:branched-chain amino acid ABC transporter permease n=1 Tax=Kitasatospora sp. RG8 TaxID=2820815 RepID=UPI001ADFC815|nr:branched-chain amino acid ABC transporter permease [Kitasatospora sp. RG8]